MKRKKSLHIMQRAPRRGLLSICSPIHDIQKEKDWMVQLGRLVLLHGLEGLSANQAGINKQCFITNVKGDGIRIYINPILTITDYDQHPVTEYCYSYPRSDVVRNRHADIILDYLTFSGKERILDTADIKFSRPIAAVLSDRIQHEMEHMYGLDVRTAKAEGEGLEFLTSQPIRVLG